MIIELLIIIKSLIISVQRDFIVLCYIVKQCSLYCLNSCVLANVLLINTFRPFDQNS